MISLPCHPVTYFCEEIWNGYFAIPLPKWLAAFTRTWRPMVYHEGMTVKRQAKAVWVKCPTCLKERRARLDVATGIATLNIHNQWDGTEMIPCDGGTVQQRKAQENGTGQA